MRKVFLVEDESVIRIGLQENIPWEQYGFTLVGTASDGEVALPQIRKTKPDILITDIKMPFMDGLTLSRIVIEELPHIKIVFISGYDAFEYAQQAIEIGVEKYLLKPITKGDLIQTLQSIKTQLDEEREQGDFDRRYQLDAREYEQYARQTFFERLTSGVLTVSQIYEQAKKLNIELDATAYNLVLFFIQPTGTATMYSEPVARLHEELMQFFMRHGEYVPFRWQLMNYAVLIRGDSNTIAQLTERCVENIRRRCNGSEESVTWYVSVGTPVPRLSGLATCFSKTSQLLSYRHLLPQHHILTDEQVAKTFSQNEGAQSLDQLDMEKLDRSMVTSFLETGTQEELPQFVAKYIDGLGSAIHSMLFRQYLSMDIRFTATIKMKALGYTQEEFIRGIDSIKQLHETVTAEDLPKDLQSVLSRAIEFRDNRSKKQYRDIMQKAQDYIHQNYASDTLSLNAIAKSVNLSANYFSAIFSQEMGMTFVEYLTQIRMNKARHLLRHSPKRSGEIAFEVGYRDPRYFSFLFKKTQGCTPSQYRAKEEADL